MTIVDSHHPLAHSYVLRIVIGVLVCAAIVFLVAASAAQAQVVQIPLDPNTSGDGLYVDVAPNDPSLVTGGAELTGTITKAKGRIKSSGHKLILKQEICNKGDVAAGPFPVSLFLSEDETWDPDDELLQSFMMQLLEPATCSIANNAAHKFKVSGIPSLDGMFAIVVIDPNHDVTSELSTTDNVLATTLEGPFLSSGKRVPGQFHYHCASVH